MNESMKHLEQAEAMPVEEPSAFLAAVIRAEEQGYMLTEYIAKLERRLAGLLRHDAEPAENQNLAAVRPSMSNLTERVTDMGTLSRNQCEQIESILDRLEL